MKEAIQITEYEIKWHKENRGKGKSAEYEEGFIKGMEQLLKLFKRAQNLRQKELIQPQPDDACPICGSPLCDGYCPFLPRNL
jgi:hypothetical protein